MAAEPEGLVSVSFGLVDVLGSERRSRTVEVVNKGAETMRFDIALIQGFADVPGVELSLTDNAPVTVAARSTRFIDVELTATAAAMRQVCDPDSAGAIPVKSLLPGVSLPNGPMPMVRHCPAEEAGTLVLTPQPPHADHPQLRLPVHAVLRPISGMAADIGGIFLGGPTASFEVPLVGDGLDSGKTPPGIRSLVSAFELAETSPNEAVTPPAQDFWDLRYVGATSDFRARTTAGQGLADTVISFAIVTHAPWAHSSQVEVNVRVDSDRDGDFENTVENLPLLRWGSDATDDHPHWSDVVWVVLEGTDGAAWQMPVNGLAADVADTRLLNSDVMVLPVRPPTSVRRGRIGVRLQGRSRRSVGRPDHGLDRRAYLRPGAARPRPHRLTPLASMYWDDLDGASIPVSYDREAYLANGSEGLLLIHHHNASGERAEVVEIVVGHTDTGGEPFPVEVE